MTCKEFYRRIEAYIPLNRASQLFEQHFDADYIYSVTLVFSDRKVHNYCYDIQMYIHDYSIVNESMALYFDRFDKGMFDIQVRYFQSFYSRCSVIQKTILRQSVTLDYLIKYVS